jgi:hypothetical protein
VETLLDMPLTRPLQGPCKPGIRSAGTEIRDHVQGSEIRSSEKAPALARRPSPLPLNRSESHGPHPTPTDDEPDPRDRQGANRSGPPDRRRGMEGADQRSPGRIGFRAPGSGSDQCGDDKYRTSAHEAVGPAAGVLADINTRSSGDSTSAPPLGGGSSTSPGAGLTALRDTIARLRATGPLPSRRMERSQRRAGATSADSGNTATADRRGAERAAEESLQANTTGLGARGAKRGDV